MPNKFGGRENIEAIDFLRELNTLTHGEHASKAQSAAWMHDQFPEWAELIDHAQVWRVMPLDQPLSSEDRREIARYLSIVTGLIRDNRG